jgi:AraC family transcriptional regulator, transcriptional activator of pobA
MRRISLNHYLTTLNMPIINSKQQTRNKYNTNHLKNHLFSPHLNLETNTESSQLTNNNIKGFVLQSWECSRIPVASDSILTQGFHEVWVFCSGLGWHEIKQDSHIIEALTVHFVPKNSYHKIHDMGESAGYRLLFKESFFDNGPLKKNLIEAFPFFQPFSYGYTLKFREHTFYNLLSDINQIKDIYCAQNNDNRRIETIQILLYLIFLYCYQETKTISNAKLEQYKRIQVTHLSNLQNIIEDNYKKRLTVGECAKMMYMSVSQLNRHCKAAYQKTVLELIHERIVNEAKDFLTYSNISIKEIAWELGFITDSNFVEFFTKIEGISPAKFRKQINDENS